MKIHKQFRYASIDNTKKLIYNAGLLDKHVISLKM